MKLLLEVFTMIIMFAFMIILIVVMTGFAVIKMAIEAAIGWTEGKRHDRKD